MTARRFFRQAALKSHAAPEGDALLRLPLAWFSRRQSSPKTAFLNPARRVRTPTLLQMESAECGAVSLAIVFAYHGLHIPLETLRNECGISRDGSKASHLVRVARGYGFRAKGYTREPAQLAQMRLPLIVFWRFTHFLVVEGFSKNTVYLNDPASGRRTVTAEEFDADFTGVVLEFIPGPEFAPSGQPVRLFALLGERLRGAWMGVWGLLLIGVALIPLNLALPVLTQIFIDSYWVARETTWLLPLLTGMALTAVFRALINALQGRLLNRLYRRLNVAGAGRFLWHLLRLPVLFYSQRSAGEVSQRLAINQRVAALLAGEVAESILAVLMALCYLLGIALFDVRLAALTLAVAAANGLILRALSQHRAALSQQAEWTHGQWMGTAMNGLRSIESLKAAGNESEFFTRWAGWHTQLLNRQHRLMSATLWLGVLPTLLNSLNSIALLVLGGLGVMAGTLSLGALVAVQSLAMSFSQSIHRLLDLGGKLQLVAGDMQRLDDVLKQPQDPVFLAAPVW